MASQVIETVLRFRTEGEALRQIAGDAEKAATGVGKIAAAAGVVGAAVGLVAGFASGLGRLTLSAQEANVEMLRLGQITEGQARSIDTAAASVRVFQAEWQGLVSTLAGGSLVEGFFTGAAVAVEALTRTIKGEAIGAWEDLYGAISDTGDALAGVVTYETLYGVIAGRTAFQLKDVLALQKQITDEQERQRKEAEHARDEARTSELAAGEGFRAAKLFQADQAKRMREFEATLGPDGLPAQTAAAVALPAGFDTAGLSALKDEHAETAMQIVGIWTSAVSSITSAMSGFFDGNTRAQKAWALISIAINTAVAIMQAFATYGPTPVGYAAAASMGIAGAVQFAAAAAGKMGGGASGRAAGGATSSAAANVQSASSMYDPGPQGGGGSARRGRNEITLRTVAGRFADIRDVIEELDRVGTKLRLHGAR